MLGNQILNRKHLNGTGNLAKREKINIDLDAYDKHYHLTLTADC